MGEEIRDEASIFREIREIVERILNDYDPEAPFSRLTELILEVKERKLWRRCTKPDGTPFRSFKDFLDEFGITDLPHFVVLKHTRAYTYQLKAYERVRALIGEDIVKIGLNKAVSLNRLITALGGLSADALAEWVELAKTVPLETLKAAVQQAIESKDASVPRGKVRAVWALEEQWSIVDQAYQAYQKTTDDPYFGRFLELAAASYLASLGDESSIVVLAEALRQAITQAEELIPEENAALRDLVLAWRDKLSRR